MHHREVEIGGVEPLIKDAIAKRDYAKREVGKWNADGIVDDDQARAMVKTQSGHEVDPPYSNAPRLMLELHAVVSIWASFGQPVTVFSGMALGITDHRPTLYPARLAWLSENGITDVDERALLLELWAVLDETKLNCAVERLNKQAAELKK